jgi:tRNA threonylcarbamoyladenosine biosynthesis protein TsaB
MLILTIRTDNPEAEIGLYEDEKQLAYETWHAHRELSATIHKKIADVLALQGSTLQKLSGVVCFKGPGSFTGLRIGLTVADALAYGLEIPIVGTTGETWQADGIQKLLAGENEKIALPEYGAEANITKQKK